MPLSMTAKAMLCLCPPAMMAGTVATVPAVKRAVHHLTARRHTPASARPVAIHAMQPRVRAGNRIECAPVAPIALPAVPIVTYAAPIPDEPDGMATNGGGTPGAIGVLAAAAAVGAPASSTPAAAPTDIGAVPEPATWLMMIGGFGALGLALRRRRVISPDRRKIIGAKATIGAMLWSSGVAADAGEMAAAATVKTTMAAKTTATGIAGKALLCVCPAALVAGSVMTVPPFRQAVHASTASPSAAAPAGIADVQTAKPCDGAVTVPVSTASLDGFPASVDAVSTQAL